MNNYYKIIGVLHIVFGILGLVVAFFLYQAITGTAPVSGRLGLYFRPWGFGAILASLFSLVSLPSIVSGLAALAQKAWAKPALLVLSFVNLFNIPLGMILGIYTIWTLTHSEADELPQAGAKTKQSDDYGISRLWP